MNPLEKILNRSFAPNQTIDNKKINHENLIKNKARAGISKRFENYLFDSFIVKNSQQDHAKNVAVDVVHKLNERLSPVPNLIMTGKWGTGKTMLASCMINEMIERRHSAGLKGVGFKIITAINLIRSLKETWSKDTKQTEKSLLNFYCTLPFLVVDEVGIQFDSDTEKLFLFDVFDGRYQNMLPTVIISNLNLEALKKTLGPRILDRLREDGGKVIAMDFESQRGLVNAR